MYKVFKIDLNNSNGTYDIPEGYYIEGTLYTSDVCVVLMLREIPVPVERVPVLRPTPVDPTMASYRLDYNAVTNTVSTNDYYNQASATTAASEPTTSSNSYVSRVLGL